MLLGKLGLSDSMAVLTWGTIIPWVSMPACMIPHQLPRHSFPPNLFDCELTSPTHRSKLNEITPVNINTQMSWRGAYINRA